MTSEAFRSPFLASLHNRAFRRAKPRAVSGPAGSTPHTSTCSLGCYSQCLVFYSQKHFSFAPKSAGLAPRRHCSGVGTLPLRDGTLRSGREWKRSNSKLAATCRCSTGCLDDHGSTALHKAASQQQKCNCCLMLMQQWMLLMAKAAQPCTMQPPTTIQQLCSCYWMHRQQ